MATTTTGPAPEPVELWSHGAGGPIGVASGPQGFVERVNPARLDEVVGRVATVDAGSTDAVVRAAHRAFGPWSARAPEDRAGLLLAAADRVAATAEELGPLLARELGKVVADCRGEMGFAAAYLRHAVAATAGVGAATEVDDDLGRLRVIRRPYGVCAAIVPWNAPLILSILKVAPALATGNTVVLKPSARTPLSALRFAELIADELPAGVLNVLAGAGSSMGDMLVAHPKVRMVSITGDTVTGKHIAEVAAGTVKRLHLELGGKAPVIVFDDADVDLAAETLKMAGYWNAGQDCTAACRVIAGPKVYDQLLAELADQVKTIKWGNPADADDLDMGSLIAKAQADKVEGMVNRALEAKAELVLGGARPDRPGAYFEPTVIANPDQRSEIVQDEVFGPVVTVQRFSDEEQAVRWANDVKFGLASSLFTGSIGRAMRVARRLEFGTVWINEHFTLASETPHGGVKESGWGKDGSKYALEDYTVVKHITINTGV